MDSNRPNSRNKIFIAASLLDCVEDCDLRNVEILLREQHADPNVVVPQKGFSPLHFVIGVENEEFAEAATKLFLENGGNPNVRSDEGLTPVHVAAAWGRTSILKMLLVNGGDPLLVDHFEKDALQYAFEEEFWDATDVIYEFLQSREPQGNEQSGACAPRTCLQQGRSEAVGSPSNHQRPGQPSITPGTSNDSSTSEEEEKCLASANPSPTPHRSAKRTSIMPVAVLAKEAASSAVGGRRPQEALHSEAPSGSGLQRRTDDRSRRVEEWIANQTGSPMADVVDESSVNCTDSENVESCREDSARTNNTSCGTFVTVSDWYVHSNEEGVALLEERVDPLPASSSASSRESAGSVIILDSDSESCGTESLRRELLASGLSSGPITASTKRVYRRQLARERSQAPRPPQQQGAPPSLPPNATNYSPELSRSLEPAGWSAMSQAGCELERRLVEDFTCPSRRDPGGKTNFCYLLLDPRITSNLPGRSAQLQPHTSFAIFVRAVFYVGKGRRARPFKHLFHAAALRQQPSSAQKVTAKDQRILDIWRVGCGVVCLQVFHNMTTMEAYTREAAMIDARGVAGLCNEKRGEYHGQASGWPMRERRTLGCFLLRQALMVFLAEGERHLRPCDLA